MHFINFFVSQKRCKLINLQHFRVLYFKYIKDYFDSNHSANNFLEFDF